MYSQCHRFDRVPESWNILSTILIHNKENPKDPGNYHPIALLVCMYNIYTSLLTDFNSGLWILSQVKRLAFIIPEPRSLKCDVYMQDYGNICSFKSLSSIYNKV